ncbi:MAG: choice-of-anchor L domain-containing protein [Bacteroidota bacterium]|nr:choice-of-anchor L domain-containing protein [Bacteroidota bacterium]
MKTKVIILPILLFLLGGALSAQPLQIFPYSTYPVLANPTNLVENVLITGCLQAYNVSYTGDNQSIGYFHLNPAANPPNFPFTGGVVMTSGLATNAAGPNNSSSVSYNSSGPSDPNLNALIPQSTNDACVLEFDFIPADNVMAFHYMFGSDEYLEWVNSSFNDVFAFFLTGPNPNTAAPAYSNLNIALVPGTPTPVSINNVNNVANSAYYYNNGTGSTPSNEACQYDGYTVPLWAHKAVIPCETYHIKLAVADAGDSALDSGVFLEEGSFLSGEVVSMNNINPVGTNNTIIEGCENYYVFTRTDTTDMSLPLDILMNISGTASVGSDISGFPTAFSIPIGQTADTIFYSALLDNIAEGTEYLVFTLLNGCPCTIGSTADTIWIIENVTLEGGIVNNDTLICNPLPQTVILHAVVSTDPSITHFLWGSGETTSSISVQPPTGDITTYYLQVWDDCGQTLEDSVTITVSDLSTATVVPVDLVCNDVCTGSVNIVPDNGFAPFTYAWSPAGLGSATSGVATTLCAGTYSTTIHDIFGCTYSESFIITEPPAVTLDFTSSPATCPGASDGSLTVTVNNGFPLYDLTCSTQGSAIGISSSTYTFDSIPTGNYTVNVVDGRGCLSAGVFTVDELELTYTTTIDDVSCFGYQDGSVSINITGGTAPYNYEWSTGITTSNLQNVVTGNYYCTVIDAHDCSIVVPVTIEEPDVLTMANSLDTTMCLSETATLEVMAYGGTTPYTYQWSDASLSGGIVHVSPTISTQYTVTVFDANNCNASSPGVFVELFPAVTPTAYANIDSICKGESTVIYCDVTGGNGGPYFFTDENDDPIEIPMTVDPEVTYTYTLFAKDDCGSPQDSSIITIFVMDPDPGEFLTDDSVGCAPFTVQFTETSPDVGQSFFWNFGDLVDNGYANSKNPVYTFEHAGSFDISLTITSDFGCKTTIVYEEFITVLPQPNAEFLPDRISTSMLDPVIHFENLTSGGVIDAIYYDFGDGHQLDQEIDVFMDVQHLFQDTGRYVVRMIAENTVGCLDTCYQIIRILSDESFYAPNAFNPTSPNIENRTFRPLIYGADIENYHLIIFDRWGHKVFETFNFYHGWDGRINDGKIGQIGSYTWTIIFKDKLGKTIRKSGIVNLIR